MKKYNKIINIFIVAIILLTIFSFTVLAQNEDESMDTDSQVIDSTSSDIDDEYTDETSSDVIYEDTESYYEESQDDFLSEVEEESTSDEDVVEETSSESDYSEESYEEEEDYTASLSNRRPNSSSVKNSDEYGTLSTPEESSTVQPKNIGNDYDKLAEVLFFVFLFLAVGCVIGLIVFNAKAAKRNKSAKDVDTYAATSSKKKKPAHSKSSEKKRYRPNEFKDPDKKSSTSHSRKH